MSESLKTDLYELTMAAALLRAGRNPPATFELFVRRMPPNRGYLVVAGLAQVVEFLENFRFAPEDLGYLQNLPVFAGVNQAFFAELAGLRFTGDLRAMPEGSLAFAGEPLLQVTAPLVQAQLLETMLLALVTFQTMVATKASRVVAAAAGRPVADFGSRRAHGAEAGVLAARASYIGGCVATSNVEAGRRFGLPVTGTMAHSFVMAFPDEEEAFRRYVECFGSGTTLLIDTYDTLAGARRAARLGEQVEAVRLDSGDLATLSRRVRKQLDAAGRSETRIFFSSELNEYRIERLLSRGASVDAFGVGTEMVTSQDAPTLDGVYKVVELTEADGSATFPVKLSSHKPTWPGRKQVYRRRGKRGELLSDVVQLDRDVPPEGEPLLVPILQGGRPVCQLPDVHHLRRRAAEQLGLLPPRYRRLRKPANYPVRYDGALEDLRGSIQASKIPIRR